MHPSSSSGAHYPAIDAERNVPGDRSGIKEFSYYYTLFQPEPNGQPLTSDALDEHFGTHIHHDGTPVLFTEAVPETKVKDALNSYRKVWIVGPTSGGVQPRYMHLV
ncbi:uncharacterized protein UBRO_20879 [Ustilago bromivora]|uniref:Uncharacterized protein n=1 Tax=Ustilago bromivora TaxID=307758 RepID=A0A1K0G6C1_9BASI|nr:uncharacterized protein UBRO_03616 [Ustilago bromivora]SAM85185.1 uncharacterized protein UBRO_20879 [Ustilago bromivora]